MISTIKKLFLIWTLIFVVSGSFFASVGVPTAHAQSSPVDLVSNGFVGADIQDDTQQSSWFSGIFSGAAAWVNNLLWAIPKYIGQLFRFVASLFLAFGSWCLSTAITYSFEPLDQRFGGIQIGWEVMRDFANLFFIFIILYIAIQTILQLGNHSTKQMLVRVIVVALLINFSAFFTKVIIDAGNIVAIGFYNKILESPTPRTGGAQCSKPGAQAPCSIADRFMDAMDINRLATTPTGAELGNKQVMMLFFMTGIMYIAAGAIFIKGAFYFISRMIAFAFLIMFSPLAFLSYAFPSGRASHFIDEWWKKLTSYTLLAPFYMIIIYLIFQIIASPNFLSPNTSIMDFVLVIGLLYAGTELAFEMASSSGAKLADWGTKIVTGAAIGVGTGAIGLAGRQVLGRTAAWRADNQKLKDAAQESGVRGAFARMRLSAYEKGAKGSWDIAQSKYGAKAISKLDAEVPGILTRGEGGFKKSGGIEDSLSHTLLNKGGITKAKEEQYVARAKELFPDNPAAQANYLKNNMGTAWDGKSNYDNLKSKDAQTARTEINRKVREKETEKSLEKEIGNLDKQMATLDEKRKQLAEAIRNEDETMTQTFKADIETIEKAIQESKTTIQKTSQQVRPSAIAGFSEKILTSQGFAETVDRNVLSEIHKQWLDGKYQNQDILKNLNENIQKSENNKGKEYLASPEGQKNHFGYQVAESDVVRTRLYDSKSSRFSKSVVAVNELEELIRENEQDPKGDRAELAKLRERLEARERDYERLKEDLGSMVSPDALRKLEEGAKASAANLRQNRQTEKQKKAQTETEQKERTQKIADLEKEYADLQRSSSYTDIQRRNTLAEEIRNLKNVNT
jgi:hypothetical protein